MSIRFDGPIAEAVAALTGTTFGFSPSSDHNLGRVEIALSTRIEGSQVHVTVRFGVRDWSGNWDDDYEGAVAFVVLAIPA